VKIKAYFSPCHFVSFFERCDTISALEHCKRWGSFFVSEGAKVPDNYLEMVEMQWKTECGEVATHQRRIVNITVGLRGTETRFEFHFFGGVLPTCEFGFVHGEIGIEDDWLKRVLELNLADVVEAPPPGLNDQFQISGRVWSLYLHLKLEDNQGWRQRRPSDVGVADATSEDLSSVLKQEFGENVLSFRYPFEIDAMNDWLTNQDSKINPRIESALARLLSHRKISMSTWLKRRTH